MIEVTNTNDSGAGSLRAAIETSGKRIINILASGTLEALSNFTIASGNVTINGAAGGDNVFIIEGGCLDIAVANVIASNLRFHLGATSPNPSSNDPISIHANRVHIHHCDLLWGTDELIQAYDCETVIVEDCVFAEALDCSTHMEGCHSKGVFLWRNVKDVTLRRNLIAYNADRNPLLAGGTGVEIINHLVYGTGLFMYVNPVNNPCTAHIVGNMMIANEETWVGHNNKYGLRVPENTYSDQSAIYVHDNICPTRPTSNLDEFLVAAETELLTPTPVFTERTMPMPASEVETYVLENAGAFPRDVQCQRVIDNVTNRTGRIIDDPSEVI